LPRAEKELLTFAPELQDEIIHKLEMLEQFPHLGIRMEQAFSGYRCLLAGRNRFRIIYKVRNSDLVEIAYIRHCRRQITLRLVK
jgi:plasmid stabilization system protein ParE